MHPALGRSVWWWWWWRQRKRRGHLFGGAVLRVPSQRDQNGPSSTSRPKAEGGGRAGRPGGRGREGAGRLCAPLAAGSAAAAAAAASHTSGAGARRGREAAWLLRPTQPAGAGA